MANEKFYQALGTLRAEVLEYKSVAEGVIAGYRGFTDQYTKEIAALKAANPDVDTTELEALTQEISNQTDALAAATVRGTVADPAQPNEPTPPSEPGPNPEPEVVNIPVDQILNPPTGQG